MVKQLLTLTVILATQAGDGSCQAATPKACWIDTRGVRVENRLVTDVITATCDPTPRTHRLDGWIEYRRSPGEEWRLTTDKQTKRTPPDAQGLQLPVSAGRCAPGDYRTAWQATGIGPGLDERPFDYSDGDFWATTLDCKEDD